MKRCLPDLKISSMMKGLPSQGFLLSSEEDISSLGQLPQYVMAPNPLMALLPAFPNLQSWVAKTCFRLYSGKTPTDQQTC